MRLIAYSAVAAAAFMASQARASDAAPDAASLSIALNVVKGGWSSVTSKPADGASTTEKETYFDSLGMSAENGSMPFIEIGVRHGKGVIYLLPMGSSGEREFWTGYEVADRLEVGVTYARYARKYSPSKTEGTTKLSSENSGKVGLFGIYGFEIYGQDFELTAVPYLAFGQRNFETSSANESSSGFGANLELLHFHEVSKNLNVGFGVSYDWDKSVAKTDGKENQTTTTSDFGLQLGRIDYSF